MATGETRLLTDGEPRKRHPILEALSYVDIGRFAEIAQKFETDHLFAAGEIARLLGKEKADEIARLRQWLGAERDNILDSVKSRLEAVKAYCSESARDELLVDDMKPLGIVYIMLNNSVVMCDDFKEQIWRPACLTSNRRATATDILRTILDDKPKCIELILEEVKFSRAIDPDASNLLHRMLTVAAAPQLKTDSNLHVFWNNNGPCKSIDKEQTFRSIGVSADSCSLQHILQNSLSGYINFSGIDKFFVKETLIAFLLEGEEEMVVEDENDFFNALVRARKRREVRMEEEDVRRTYDGKIKSAELDMWSEYKNIIDELKKIERVSFSYGEEGKYDDARFEMNKCTCRSIDIGRDIEFLPRFEGGLEDVDIQSFKQVHEKIMASRKTVLGRLLLGIFDQDRIDIKKAAALFYQTPTEKAWRLYELYRFAVTMRASAIEIINKEFVRIDKGLLEDQLRRVFVAKTLCYIIAKIAIPQLNQELAMAGAMLAPADIAMTLSELSQASDNPLSPEATKLLEDFSNMISAQREVTHALQVGDPNDTVMTDSTGVREQVAAINSGRIAT